MSASCAAKAGLSTTSSCRAPRGAASCAARTRTRAVERGGAGGWPGRLEVLTGNDGDAAGHGELTVVPPMPFGDGRPMNDAPRPAFAREVVHHVGDIVAAVIGETRFAAEDAAEA